MPGNHPSFVDWLLQARKGLLKTVRRGFDSLILLVTWVIWKERNERVFRRRVAMPWTVVSRILDEANSWLSAGVSDLDAVARSSVALHIETPSIIEGSVLVMSKTGVGLSMFSMGS
ncbi:hypothetical protein U9M48_014833 [Paspalum notatum var. saurae]|uniref:Uncharacterized protein n=1 Tax=Paspalum notatum var. saurae TaxID=547442 RepID=A0AAQ3T2I0_PASNO